MIRSTQFFRSGTIALLAAILLSPLITAAQKNVLLIMADDYNYWTGKNGYYPQAHTPNIDALGDRGAFFTEAHSSSPSATLRATLSGLASIPSLAASLETAKPSFVTKRVSNTLPRYISTSPNADTIPTVEANYGTPVAWTQTTTM